MNFTEKIWKSIWNFGLCGTKYTIFTAPCDLYVENVGECI